MIKVYCCNCKYYVAIQSEWGGDYCDKVIGSHDEPYGRCTDRIINYKTMNKTNSCRFYQRSWWIFWVKGDR